MMDLILGSESITKFRCRHQECMKSYSSFYGGYQTLLHKNSRGWCSLKIDSLKPIQCLSSDLILMMWGDNLRYSYLLLLCYSCSEMDDVNDPCAGSHFQTIFCFNMNSRSASTWGRFYSKPEFLSKGSMEFIP